MVEGEIRMYFKPDEALEEKLKAMMRTLGFFVWATGNQMRDRELCFLPVEASPDYYEDKTDETETT